MEKAARSCCRHGAPAQHPRLSLNVSAPHIRTVYRPNAHSHASSCSLRCEAVSSHEYIHAPTSPSLVDLSSALEKTFQASYCIHGVDIVLITKPCPYTLAELASVDDMGSFFFSRYPDAVVYMCRATYNEVCENVARIESPEVKERAMRGLELISDRIRIFDHSWTIASGLKVSSIAAGGKSQPPATLQGVYEEDSLPEAHADVPPSILCDDTPVHILADAPVTITKGAFVGSTEESKDPWFKLNHDVDRRGGSAGRAKLLKTVASGGAMHVFHDATPDNASTDLGVAAPLQWVEWKASPEVQRFCPTACSHQ